MVRDCRILTEENHGFLPVKYVILRHFLDVFISFSIRFNQLLQRPSEPVDQARSLLPLVHLAERK